MGAPVTTLLPAGSCIVTLGTVACESLPLGRPAQPEWRLRGLRGSWRGRYISAAVWYGLPVGRGEW